MADCPFVMVNSTKYGVTTFFEDCCECVGSRYERVITNYMVVMNRLSYYLLIDQSVKLFKFMLLQSLGIL